MKLPNGDQVIVDIAKLRDYSLNPKHPEGKHKARLFASALGLTQQDAQRLMAQLVVAAREGNCQLGRKTAHGQRYILDFTVDRQGARARLRSVWNVRPSEDFPPLVTCYVL
jgi:hypothetical protein